MNRLLMVTLSVVCCGSVDVRANTISLVGSGILAKETPNQNILLTLTGTNNYTDSNFVATIGAGGPFVTRIFGKPVAGSFDVAPVGSLVGSIWAGGAGGILIGGLGLTPQMGVGTPGFLPQNTNGVYVVLTMSTVGVAPGVYTMNLAGTNMFNGLDDFFDPIPSPLDTPDVTLTVTPEPSSIAIAAIGLVGLAAWRRRRRR